MSKILWSPGVLFAIADVPYSCPKCGTLGLNDRTPEYVDEDSEYLLYADVCLRRAEHLKWKCPCGYVMLSVTRDHKAAPE